MATSRRKFLKTGTMCALFAGIPGIVANVAKGNSTAVSSLSPGDPVHLTRASFAPYLNTMFRVRIGPLNVLKLKLVKATDLKAASAHPSRIAGRESFSLMFAGSSRSPLLTDNIQVIEHHALGKFSLFLASVEKPAQRHYEAIITRL